MGRLCQAEVDLGRPSSWRRGLISRCGAERQEQLWAPSFCCHPRPFGFELFNQLHASACRLLIKHCITPRAQEPAFCPLLRHLFSAQLPLWYDMWWDNGVFPGQPAVDYMFGPLPANLTEVVFQFPLSSPHSLSLSLPQPQPGPPQCRGS